MGFHETPGSLRETSCGGALFERVVNGLLDSPGCVPFILKWAAMDVGEQLFNEVTLDAATAATLAWAGV